MTCECYFGMCPFHEKDEPFCNEVECHATDTEITLYRRIRKLELSLSQTPSKLIDGLQGRYRIVDTLNSPNMAEWEVVSRDNMIPIEIRDVMNAIRKSIE